MTKLKGYHCNICAGWIWGNESHTCDPTRIDIIDRITDFFSQSQHSAPEQSSESTWAKQIKDQTFPENREPVDPAKDK